MGANSRTRIQVLHNCGFKLDPPGAKAVKHGDAKKRLPKDFKSVARLKEQQL